DSRNLVQRLGEPLIQKSRDGEALSAFEFYFGVDLPGIQPWNVYPPKRDTTGEIEKAYFRGHVKTNGPSGSNVRQKLDAHAKFTKRNCNRACDCAALYGWIGEFSTSQKTGLLAIDCQHIRFCQNFHKIVSLKRSQRGG